MMTDDETIAAARQVIAERYLGADFAYKARGVARALLAAAERIQKYILTCGRLGPLGGGPDPIGWLIDDHAAMAERIQTLEADIKEADHLLSDPRGDAVWTISYNQWRERALAVQEGK